MRNYGTGLGFGGEWYSGQGEESNIHLPPVLEWVLFIVGVSGVVGMVWMSCSIGL